MARRTLEAITDERGEKTGSLYERLQRLATQVPAGIADWAKEVRVVGNMGAHYDPAKKPTLEDARDLIDFLRELMKYLYELPAELARRRNKT
jgi:hypothetical protein